LFSAEFTDKQPLQQLKGNKLIIFGGGTFVGWLWANLFSFSDCLTFFSDWDEKIRESNSRKT
jgi:hypothetical protein